MSNQASLGDISDGNDKVKEESETSERTILGEIPDDWDSDIVENLFNLTNGSAREDRSSSRNTSETEGEFDVYGANGKIAKYDDSNLDKGLVVGRVGTVGSVYEIDQPAWVSDNAIKAKLDSDNNLRFLYYVMKRGRLDSLANQTAHPLLNQGIVGSVRLPTPEKDEQRRIASVLYNVDQAIGKTEEIIEQTQRVKKGLMQDLFTEGYYSHEEFEDSPTGKYPADWEIVRAGNYLDLSNGEFLKSDERDEDADYPVYGGNGILGYTDDYRVEPKTILIGRVGAYCGNVQKTEKKAWVTDNAIVVNEEEDYDSDFLGYLLSSLNLGSFSEQSAQSRISQATIENLRIPLPEKEEQGKIASAIMNVEEKISAERDHKEQLQRLKKGLMQDLLTGSVRTGEDVRVLDEVVEMES